MMILGVPVPLRSIHRFVADLLKVELWSRRQNPARIGPFLHLVFFSCARDFEPLCLAFRSIRRLRPQLVKSAIVYVDDKDPFDDEQRSLLQTRMPGLSFGESHGFAWASMGTLETELDAFAAVGQRAEPGDFVVKVDSDILFFSARKLALFPALSYDFIGDGHHEGYRYSQGGLYLIRADLARQLAYEKVETRLKAIVDRLGGTSEDLVVYNLVKELEKRILLTNLMLFPGEYERARLTGGILGKLFVAIHFVRRKHEMGHYLSRIG